MQAKGLIGRMASSYHINCILPCGFTVHVRCPQNTRLDCLLPYRFPGLKLLCGSGRPTERLGFLKEGLVPGCRGATKGHL